MFKKTHGMTRTVCACLCVILVCVDTLVSVGGAISAYVYAVLLVPLTGVLFSSCVVSLQRAPKVSPGLCEGTDSETGANDWERLSPS